MRWGIGFVVAATAFYTLSYAAIYTEPHTAKRASSWINENVPKGSVILMEHWEESIPDTRGYLIGCRGVPEDYKSCMTMYDHDGIVYPGGRDKMTKVAEQLAGGDYLVFFSNRLYGSVPRRAGEVPPERRVLPAALCRATWLPPGALGGRLSQPAGHRLH